MHDIAEQYMKPTGIIGHLIAKNIDKLNKMKYIKMVTGLNINDQDRILEIGYGSGLAIRIIGKSNALCQIEGIDFSELMYHKAIHNNQYLIKKRRLNLILGDFLQYDFGEKKYTKIYCINVIYFWDDLAPQLQKIFNLLENGGILAIYMTRSEDIIKAKYARSEIFKKYSEEQVINKLKDAGFTEVNVIHDQIKVGIGLYIYAKKE